MQSKITTTTTTHHLQGRDSMVQADGKTLKIPQSHEMPSLLKGSHTPGKPAIWKLGEHGAEKHSRRSQSKDRYSSAPSIRRSLKERPPELCFEGKTEASQANKEGKSLSARRRGRCTAWQIWGKVSSEEGK